MKRLDSLASLRSRKESIRKRILAKLKCLKSSERRTKSLRIKEKLFRSSEFKNAKTIMFFVSRKDEVDTFIMIRQAVKMGKRVAVPSIQKNSKKLLVSLIRDIDNELVKGPFSIYQPSKEHLKPIKPDKLDLIITPGIAFTREGLRLGRGKGYFDRFLKTVPKGVKKIGISFGFQILKKLPISFHDVPVDRVIAA